jgi:hypothetical protein
MYAEENEEVKALVAAKMAEAEKPTDKEETSGSQTSIPGARRTPSEFQR